MLIDVVDENDNVIGQTTKEDAHRSGDWHRVAHVWVCTPGGQVLIHKRADSKKLLPGLWDIIIGGHLDSGEDYETAAVRELAEEVGIEVEKDELVHLGKWHGTANPKAPNNREFIEIYGIRYEGAIEALKPEPKEISELRFVPLARLVEVSNDEKESAKFVSFVYFKRLFSKIENFIKD